ncbi:MAG: hypothetical protein NVV82_00520 [Sporocytophaga sp.]|nr:hypothetical protein [Sporocytophaga sp.]
MDKKPIDLFNSYLLNLKFEVSDIIDKNLINASSLDNQKKLEFLTVLETILDLRLQFDTLIERFDDLQDVAMAIATGDFDKRIDVPYTKDLFSTLGTLINVIGEELKSNVIKNHYLLGALETIPDSALITSQSGTILFSNKNASKLLNMEMDDLKFLEIANIFETQKQFGSETKFANELIRMTTLVRPFNRPVISVDLTIKKLINNEGAIDGYLYIFK